MVSGLRGATPDIREQAARMAADLSELARRTDPAHEFTGVRD